MVHYPVLSRWLHITTVGIGPGWMARAAPEVQAILTSPQVTWEQVEQVVAADLAAKGDEGMNAYGLSKAALMSYTHILVRTYPSVISSTVSPGFIDTAMTQGFGAKLTVRQVQFKPTLPQHCEPEPSPHLRQFEPHPPAAQVCIVFADLVRIPLATAGARHGLHPPLSLQDTWRQWLDVGLRWEAQPDRCVARARSTGIRRPDRSRLLSAGAHLYQPHLSRREVRRPRLERDETGHFTLDF